MSLGVNYRRLPTGAPICGGAFSQVSQASESLCHSVTVAHGVRAGPKAPQVAPQSANRSPSRSTSCWIRRGRSRQRPSTFELSVDLRAALAQACTECGRRLWMKPGTPRRSLGIAGVGEEAAKLWRRRSGRSRGRELCSAEALRSPTQSSSAG